MAIYYDEIWTLNKCSNALDPNSEWFPFMSYKVFDWQQKIGADQFTLKSYHPNWEQARDRATNPITFTRTSNIELQIEFHGAPTRAGYFASLGVDPPSYGIQWAGYSSDYLYTYLTRDYYALYGQENSSDRGQWNRRYDYNLGNTRDVFAANDFTNPRKSFVVYSDEPGEEWFAWNIMEDISSTSFGHGVIHKAKNINPEIPDSEDFTWCMSYANSVVGISPSFYNDTTYNTSWRWRCYNRANYGNFGIGSDNYLTPARIGQPILTYNGEPMGDTGDRTLIASNLVPGYSYEVGGREYLALGGSLAVRYS